MQLFRSISEAAGSLRGSAVAVGNFDGVHLGHQRLYEFCKQRAHPHGGPAVALTFDPHPVRSLRPALAPPLLTSLSRKLALMEECGLDAVVVQPFDLAYAKTSAVEFVARDLIGGLGTSVVVVGRDFTAGHERAGVGALRPLLEARGLSLVLVEPVTVEGLVVSSTKIRELLLEGNVEGASQLLGRPHAVEGEIQRGAGRGRGFGFATANMRPEAMLPGHGVYAVRARLADRWYEGVCNVGVKPTVQEVGPVTAETHLFAFDGRDTYGERLTLAFVARLREEQRFPSIDALRAQIGHDVERAHVLFERFYSDKSSI